MNILQRHYFDNLSLAISDIEVEADGENSSACECCGGKSKSVWGYLHTAHSGTVAAYFVQWTEGASLETHPANFDLIVGPWGENGGAEKRCFVSLLHLANENGEGVVVGDAQPRASRITGLANMIASREDVVGTPFGRSVFAMYDSVILQDPRLKRFCANSADL